MRYLFSLNSVSNGPHSTAATHFSIRFLLASLYLGLAAITGAQANTITVNGTGDTRANDGVCTIREAIINANNNAATWADCAAGFGADVIKLPAGTITISIPNAPSSFSAEEFNVKGDLDLTSSITIDGNPGGTTINGGALDRIFDINPDTDGDFASPTPSITVAINNLTITNGRQNDVGAIKIQPRATVSITNCTVSNSTSTENDAGAIGILSGGSLTMRNSTVSGNSSRWLAGAIKNEGALALLSCTVTNNSTFGGTPSRGQAIGSYTGTPTILRNTIVAANVAGRPDMEGVFESQGYNVIGKITDGMNTIATITPNPGTADQIGVTAAQVHLGPLAANGGPTHTHTLLVPSVAIDKGRGFGMSNDQRGSTRPCDDPGISNAIGGDGADVGAVEVSCAPSPDECCCRRVRGKLVGSCCPVLRLPLPLGTRQ
ncbi:MAG TPA: choice-of-anchor Q domain-containing protein [Pyrinomonadaceae bacterium]|jgi:hypothetical protein|nr:choice-of-anchor Q domain-containing protein [Pyrinomonadaceae bacterium]